MKIELRSHDGSEERLLFAQQIKAQVIRYFGEREKIFYVHFRNVIGTVTKYTEVFPNDGDGGMVANLRALKEVGYQGYLVPDHNFGIDADDQDYPRISRASQVGLYPRLVAMFRRLIGNDRNRSRVPHLARSLAGIC